MNFFTPTSTSEIFIRSREAFHRNIDHFSLSRNSKFPIRIDNRKPFIHQKYIYIYTYTYVKYRKKYSNTGWKFIEA